MHLASQGVAQVSRVQAMYLHRQRHAALTDSIMAMQDGVRLPTLLPQPDSVALAMGLVARGTPLRSYGAPVSRQAPDRLLSAQSAASPKMHPSAFPSFWPSWLVGMLLAWTLQCSASWGQPG